jgi:hypothetical protein
VRLEADEDLSRSQLTVFFRLVLAIPHLIWLALWGIATAVGSILGWFVTLFTGQLPDPLQRFLSAYLRYATHVGAYVYLTADPYPEFVGRPGSYPVNLHLPAEPRLQNRWKTGFRLVLAVPALMVASGLGALAFAAAFVGWFASLFTARMPRGLRQSQLLALRYTGQTYAYALLLTESYPFASPAPPAEPAPLLAGQNDLV